MKNNKEKNLAWWILGGVFILGMGSFIIYKAAWKKKPEKTSSDQKLAENNSKSNQIGSQPAISKEEELEKYLLEKRLDLQKYFVFNLGKEVKTSQQGETNSTNLRLISTNLANDLTKLTASYEKKVEAKGYGLVLGKIEELEGITGWRIPKQCITFFGRQINQPDSEWVSDKLDEKIKNGQDCYIVFEKDDEFEEVYFGRGTVDKNGKRWLVFTNTVFLRMKKPTTYIFQSKKETLEFLKNNDFVFLNN